jgi:hypothetical protein
VNWIAAYIPEATDGVRIRALPNSDAALLANPEGLQNAMQLDAYIERLRPLVADRVYLLRRLGPTLEGVPWHGFGGCSEIGDAGQH